MNRLLVSFAQTMAVAPVRSVKCETQKYLQNRNYRHTSKTAAAAAHVLQRTHCIVDGENGGIIQIATLPLESQDDSRG